MSAKKNALGVLRFPLDDHIFDFNTDTRFWVATLKRLPKHHAAKLLEMRLKHLLLFFHSDRTGCSRTDLTDLFQIGKGSLSVE